MWILFTVCLIPVVCNGQSISREALVSSLELKAVTADEYCRLIHQRGVTFRPTVVDELRIRKAGRYLRSDIELILQAIRESYRVTILASDFQSLDTQEGGLAANVFEQLRDGVGTREEVQIIPLGKPITIQQGSSLARKLGEDNKAALVIWGWVRKSQLSISLRDLERPT
jgi:hypothetical protein